MRIKWNRHLDGGASRRPEDEETAGTQEADEKKRATSSTSTSIFKIFRRSKKGRRRSEDEYKSDGNNGIVPPLSTAEANDDDCASVSSVTTCASQPVTEGFQRDRASSLFSSFRLSLPGSKRKKRRIAPTPSESLFNGQPSDTQIDRYSTPDLRKQSDKFDVPSNGQVCLSTSSPSIRSPKGSSTSAQSLASTNQNSESLDKLKWSNTKSIIATSSSKLSKSVSFSDCKDGLTDSSHSTCDNKAPRAVNSTAMVEEDSGALQSESLACLSDNPRMNLESKFTAVDSLSSAAVASGPQKKAESVMMTKKETVNSQSSNIIKNSAFANIGNLLSDIATEIQSYEKSNDINGITPADATPKDIAILSSVNSDSPNHPSAFINETNLVPVDNKKDKKYEVRVDLKKHPSVQCVETEVDVFVYDKQANSRVCDSSEQNGAVCPEKNGDIAKNSSMDKSTETNLSLNNKLEVLSSELCVLTAAGSLSNINCCDGIESHSNDVEVRKDLKKRKKFKHEVSDDLLGDKCSAIPTNNHVVCHMKIYENEIVTHTLDDCKANGDTTTICETSLVKNCSNRLISDHSSQNDTSLSEYNKETTDTRLTPSVSKSSFDSYTDNYISNSDSSYNDNYVLNRELLSNEPSALNSCSKISVDCDQKVPDNNELRPLKNSCSPNDQQVPEFELSILEFEEVCSRYMSSNNPELSDSDSTIPLYSNSPKRKSALDRNFSFICPNLLENGGSSEICFVKNLKNGDATPSRNDLIRQDVTRSHHQNSCQNMTDKYSLPSPPKQWINYQKHIDSESDRESRIGGVQCTKVRGKNLCQDSYPQDLPTVMLSDSDLEGIDTPRVSSTLDDTLENKSGRDHNSNTSGEQLSNNRTLSEEMVSNVSLTISSLTRALEYSFMPDSPGKTSIFLDSEIRDGYRGPRAICDPLVYNTEVRKSFESLGPDSYLNGHNFCDISNIGFREIISDASQDYKGLIEISNPYEDSFMIPEDLTSLNLVTDSSVSLANGHDNVVPRNNALVGREFLNENEVEIHSGDEKSFSSTSVISEELKEPVSNGKRHSVENRTQQKNSKNSNKNSMIPCRTKTTSNENKKIDTKSKTKKSNSLPRITSKNESHLPVKNNHSSHRVFTNSCKDSIAEHNKGRRKDSKPSNKQPNGTCAAISSAEIECEILENKLNSLSHHVINTTFENSNYRVVDENKINVRSDSLIESTDNKIGAFENGNLNDSTVQKNELEDSNSVLSLTSIPSIRDFEIQEPLNKCVETSCVENTSTVSIDDNYDAMLIDALCPECLHLDVQDSVDISLDNLKYRYCSDHSDYLQRSRRSSVSAVGIRKTSFTSSKESLSSQVTNSSNVGKSRIPRKQAGTTRGGGATKGSGPVRPPMWLSKAELTQEIQRLGTLCEARTKELNRLKMETKHVSVGFDAFAALFKYMVEDLNGLSVPALTQDLQKTLKQLELTKQDLAYYEREVEEMKSHHCQELNDLSNKLFEVYQSEVAELNAKHQEEVNHVKSDHQEQVDLLTANFDSSSKEEKAHYEKMVANLEQEIINQRAELQEFQEREIKDLEEKHAEGSKVLQEHIEQLQKKCAELKHHAMGMEDAMRKDTDSKLQWVTTAKCDLEKEVESLKTVLEMKNKELHTLRVQNLEMEKQLEDLPLAREKIKMLQARAEDLEALMVEKTKLERKLSTENQQMRDTYEKETKVNRRLSMENEELQWRLRQAENSVISGSFTEVPEFPEAEENAAALSPTSPTKSQLMSRSIFFTFVDKDEGIPHSPRSQYKKITPNFSANYKTSPAKTSKSPPAPSPRRGKSHSEPPQPFTTTSTPRKVAKQPLSKAKGSQKRQRSGSDSTRPNEHPDVNFSPMVESMASSVSSESSVFEHRERLLEEHKEHIIHSLEILREQRSTDGSVDEPTVLEKKWCSDDMTVTCERDMLVTCQEDMSRSAEFSDPKTYYHMTFPVLKESGGTDCDMENSSSSNSPMKEVMPNTMHSRSVNNIPSAVKASETLQVMSLSVQEVSGCTVNRLEDKRHSFTETSVSADNVQKKDCEKTENRYRTI